jgi:hypothetical protein
MHRKHKGSVGELTACIWLLKAGYEVFRNVSQHGEIDLVAIRDGVIYLLDASSEPNRSLSETQAKMNVKRISALPDGTCQIETNTRVRSVPRQYTCAQCKNPFKGFRKQGMKNYFCSFACRNEWRSRPK